MVIDLYQDVIVIILYVELFSIYLAVSVPLAVSWYGKDYYSNK